jgi:hypothetical protein
MFREVLVLGTILSLFLVRDFFKGLAYILKELMMKKIKYTEERDLCRRILKANNFISTLLNRLN